MQVATFTPSQTLLPGVHDLLRHNPLDASHSAVSPQMRRTLLLWPSLAQERELFSLQKVLLGVHVESTQAPARHVVPPLHGVDLPKLSPSLAQVRTDLPSSSQALLSGVQTQDSQLAPAPPSTQVLLAPQGKTRELSPFGEQTRRLLLSASHSLAFFRQASLAQAPLEQCSFAPHCASVAQAWQCLL